MRDGYSITPVGPVETVVIDPPKHGRLEFNGKATQSFPGAPFDVYGYVPDPGFVGEDHFTAEVTVMGARFTVPFIVHVLKEDLIEDYCSSPDEADDNPMAEQPGDGSTHFPGYGLAELATTFGSGADHRVILNDDAASCACFIDFTGVPKRDVLSYRRSRHMAHRTGRPG